ncbi:MAG: ABC transporter ATP-binding protein [Proteobacteria bacterium]|nr:ABC transporter ATP-binding protein [Pseudomonadota bacterium]
MKNIVEGSDIVKNYGSFPALRGINFFVKEGEIVAFLGPNGAGKTTLIKLITCTSKITSGRLSVFGKDISGNERFIKSMIGVVPQDNNLDPDFTVEENLFVYSRYFFMKKNYARKIIDDLLSFVSLSDKKDVNVQDLSGGMKRRLIIARSLINDPQLVILDEPTTGLDPQARRHIWEKIIELKRMGKTVILTTHYMEEAESLCDRVYIMDLGKIILEGSPKNLIENYLGEETVEIFNCEERLISSFPGKKTFFKDRVYIHHKDKREILERLMALCNDAQFVVRPSNLEDLFIYLTGKELKE